MNDEMYLEGSGCGLNKALSCNFLGGTEENHRKLHSGYPVSQPRLKLNASQIQA
jgi:hypothetical protein